MVALWSLNHPIYALVLCTNRDELLSRPTVNADWHSFDENRPNSSVLSGRDLVGGGTWFGINKDGRVPLVMNIFEFPDANASPTHNYANFTKDYTEITTRHVGLSCAHLGVSTNGRVSRGELPASFLLPMLSQHVNALVGKTYGGFNLLFLEPSFKNQGKPFDLEPQFVTNSGTEKITARDLSDDEKKCGGFSLGIDGAPVFPKVEHGVAALEVILSESQEEQELIDKLFELLLWQPEGQPNGVSQLYESIQVKPFALRVDSMEAYELCATRVSTVVLIRHDGRVVFIERDIWKLDGDRAVPGDPADDRKFEFSIPGYVANA